MKKESYPQSFKMSPKPPFDLKKWKETALKVRAAMREYTEYTPEQLVGHFIRNWDYQEQESFKKWFEETKRGQQDMNMQKIAYDYNAANKEQQLNELKKKLRSRINSAERLLNKMFDEGLLAGNDDKALYMGRILQKLKEEVNLLKRPQLIEARHRRASGIFRKAGLPELADIMIGSVSLVTSFGNNKLVKTAAEDEASSLTVVMESIKEELDIFNYGVHLDKLMQIRAQLTALGRHSEADMILGIIKKELDDVEGIHKKLVEVYTSLGQVPRMRKPKVTKPVEPQMEMPREPVAREPMSQPMPTPRA